jgi:hypothetical protein
MRAVGNRRLADRADRLTPSGCPPTYAPSRRLCSAYRTYGCALRYAVITDAGTLPRALTVNPVSRAQERTSALLAATADRGASPLRDFFPSVPATPAPVPGVVLAAGFGRDVDCWMGLLVPGPSLETTSMTPYMAPRTRIASSRDSLESRVSFKALPFHMAAMAAQLARVGQ